MDLLKAIHDRWAADATLDALLDSQYVHTGIFQSQSPEPPYATITLTSDSPRLNTNDGSQLREVTVRVSIVHANHDAGRQIVEAVRAAFHRAAFTLDGGSEVINSTLAANSELQDSQTGVWQFSLDLLFMVYLA
jgi:hypothetical protein